MDLTKSHFIGAPEAVWRALTDPAVIDAWGGDIFGTVTAAEPPHRLVQEWWGDDVGWDEASVATFELSPQGEGTRFTLAHTNVPDDEADEFDAGWDDHYLGAMKELLD